METKIMTVNKKGMVTIPYEIRKKFNIQEGNQVAILELNGEIQIIPILDFDQIRPLLPTRAEMKQIYYEARKEELELEN